MRWHDFILHPSSLILVVLLVCAAPAGGEEAAHKVRLAVLPFKNVATSIPEGTDVGRSVADMLITELFKLKRYELVERNQLDRLVQERNFQKSDLADASAREMAKVLKCDALVVGSISQYAETRKDADFAFFRKEKAEFTVGIEFRILDAETGATRLAESAVGTVEKEGRSGGLLSGKKKEEGAPPSPAAMEGEGITGGYGEAARAAVDMLIAKLRAAFPIEGYVADVDPDKVTIDLGRFDNISVGDRFKVVKMGKEIMDPVTKEKLGAKTEDVGEVQIIEVIGDRLSTAKIVSGAGKMEIGNKVIAISMQALIPPAPKAAEDEEDKPRKKASKKHHGDDDDDDDHHDHDH
jgi:hypothetical protein